MDDLVPGDLGLLLLRLVLGLTYVLHGLRKLGWRNPKGFVGFGASIARRGYRPAKLWAIAAVSAEIGGGVLAILGLLTPVAAALLVGQSVTILLLVRGKGFWHDEGGIEYPLMLTAASLLLAFAGAGSYALDAVLGIGFPWLGAGLALLVIGGAFLGLVTRGPEKTRA